MAKRILLADLDQDTKDKFMRSLPGATIKIKPSGRQQLIADATIPCPLFFSQNTQMLLRSENYSKLDKPLGYLEKIYSKLPSTSLQQSRYLYGQRSFISHYYSQQQKIIENKIREKIMDAQDEGKKCWCIKVSHPNPSFKTQSYLTEFEIEVEEECVRNFVKTISTTQRTKLATTQKSGGGTHTTKAERRKTRWDNIQDINSKHWDDFDSLEAMKKKLDDLDKRVEDIRKIYLKVNDEIEKRIGQIEKKVLDDFKFQDLQTFLALNSKIEFLDERIGQIQKKIS